MPVLTESEPLVNDGVHLCPLRLATGSLGSLSGEGTTYLPRIDTSS
jgi:hypothetical protein